MSKDGKCKCGDCKCGNKRQAGDPSYTAQDYRDSVARLEDGLAKLVANRINRGRAGEERIMAE